MHEIQNFFKDESGIETLEYGVIAAIVTAVAVLIYAAGWGSSVKTQILNAASQNTGTVTT